MVKQKQKELPWVVQRQRIISFCASSTFNNYIPGLCSYGCINGRGLSASLWIFALLLMPFIARSWVQVKCKLPVKKMDIEPTEEMKKEAKENADIEAREKKLRFNGLKPAPEFGENLIKCSE